MQYKVNGLVATPVLKPDFALTEEENANESTRHFATSSVGLPPPANHVAFIGSWNRPSQTEDSPRVFATLGSREQVAYEPAEGGYPIHRFQGRMAWEVEGLFTQENIQALGQFLLDNFAQATWSGEPEYIEWTLHQPHKDIPYYGYC